MNQFGRIDAEDRLGHGVVIGIANAADRRLDAHLGEPLGVADRQVLHVSIAVVNELADVRPGVDRLFESIESPDDAPSRLEGGPVS
jgi:hypothetical protein